MLGNLFIFFTKGLMHTQTLKIFFPCADFLFCTAQCLREKKVTISCDLRFIKRIILLCLLLFLQLILFFHPEYSF